MKLEFSRQIFGRKGQISDFLKISPVGAELFNSDGQTDMTMLIVAFRNFANALQVRWSPQDALRQCFLVYFDCGYL
jgi:hypothetical protein